MTKEKDELRNGLQGVMVDDSAHENEGTMVTLEEAHSSGCSYHKQTVSIIVTVKYFFLVIQKFLNKYWYVFENANMYLLNL